MEEQLKTLRAEIEAGQQVEFRLLRLNRLHTVLSKIADTIMRTHDRQELYDAVCRILVEDGLLRMVFVTEVDVQAKLARPVASHGAGQESLREPTGMIPTNGGPLSMGTVGTAIRTGAHDICNDIAGASRMKPWHETAQKNGLLANASFPLKLHGATVAVLVLYAGEADYFLDDEIRLMATVAKNLSFALEALEKEQHRKRAEESLRESEERFRNMFTAAATGIATSTPQGRFLQVNAAYCQILGYTEDELLSCNFAALTHPDDLTLNLKLRDEMLAGTRDSFVMEKRYLKKSGDIIWTRHSVSCVRATKGEITMFVVVAEDITERKKAELALQLQQSELRALFDLIPAMVWFKDTKNNFLRVNRRVTEATGKSIADIEGKSALEIYPQEAAKYYADDLAVIQAGAPKLGIIEKLRDSAGKVLWVQTDKVPYRDIDGKIVGIVVMAQDLTERKRIETRFRRLVDSNAQAVCLWNIKGEITDGNDAFLKLTRYTREDLEAGRINWAAMTPPEYAESDQRALKELAATGVCAAYEKEWIRKDGTRVPILLGAAIFEDNPDEGVCFVLDLSERKRSEALLHLRDRAIQAVSQAILITDSCLPDNPIVYASPSFEQMTGYSAEEAIGRNCRFLQGKNTDPQAVTGLREAISQERTCTVELLNYRKDGTAFWNNLTVSPVRDQSKKLVNFVGVQTDVTQRKQLEEQLRQSQKMEAIGQLAGGIAHDFNNLLTVINGYSDVLISSLPPDDPSQRFLGFIKEAGQQSQALTSQMLAFSRKQLLSAKALNLNEVVLKIEKMLRRIIGEDIQLFTGLHPELGSVMADQAQIEQILLNLAVNARDAMPQGGKLTIETKHIDLDESYARTHTGVKPGAYVMLAVTDSGVGIPEEVRQHIFEPFFTTKGMGKGTGLGLSVVHGVVKQSGGSIEVYSEPGQGTCFKIYLPQIAGTVLVETPASDTKEFLRGTETILLVEDEPNVREFARHVLEGYGYTILVAGNAKEALRISAQHKTPIHLLLTDVVMPGTGGRALAEQLQPTRPEMKVLFMSGYTEDAVVRHGILHEEVNFLQKPYSPLALAQKVREVLK